MHFTAWLFGFIDDKDGLSYLGNYDEEGLLMEADLEMGIRNRLPRYDELFPMEEQFLDETEEMRNQRLLLEELKNYFLTKDKFIDKELKQLGF